MGRALNPMFFVGTFGVLLVLCAVAAILHQRNRQKVPRWAVLVLAVLAGLQIVLAGAFQLQRQAKMRLQLQAIASNRVTSLTLSTADLRADITNRADIDALVGMLRGIDVINAHHSYPTGIVDLMFQYDGNSLHYRLGQDSERANEFWVFDALSGPASSRGQEVGRIQSAELGQTLQRLTRK